MERNVEIDKISDGKRYGANDLVKVGCDDCRGCSACCNGMGDSIVLDPMDVYRLEKKLGKTMEEILLAGNVALRVVDGVILPHLKMTEQSDQCSFLKDTNVYTGICRNRLEEPSLAIGGEIFHRILETCRTNMDYIILDTPPMGMTADAEELAEYADAAVLSVRQDGVLTRDINDAIDALNQKEEKVIGCVFGNVYPGFGERIGNSYGYGYGYGTYSRAER